MEAKQRELLKYLSDAGQKRPGSRLGKKINQEILNLMDTILRIKLFLPLNKNIFTLPFY